MNKVFLEWLQKNKGQFVGYGIVTDDLNVVENNMNLSTTVDHSSTFCLGRISVWQSGLMDIEILHIDTEKSLLFEHHELERNADFSKILKRYFIIMSTGKFK